MESTTFLELSRSALRTNIAFIRNLLRESQFSSVVKGNAYGHGITTLCPILYEEGLRHFSVFSADEASSLMDCLPEDITVVIMGQTTSNQLEWCIDKEVQFFVFEKDRLENALRIAQKVGKKAKIHLELETGMNRTGFPLTKLEELLDFFELNQEFLEMVGVCSHLAGAESIANYKRVKDQTALFIAAKEQIIARRKEPILFHLACSAASIQYPDTQLDLVRIGILQYGFFPSNEVLVHYLSRNEIEKNPLKRVISWKTEVMDVKIVPTGEFVGYGTSYLTNRPTTVAVLPVGYSHGFSRSLSNQGKVLIQGQRFDVIGTVNMNMTLVDITDGPLIQKGDEVVLIGHQGELEITVSSFSEFSDLVNYELLTRLPDHIERRVVD